MKIQTFTCIEVKNVPNIWAVDLFECQKNMKPIVPKFVSVNNSYDEKEICYVEHILSDVEPTKIINGVNGVIPDSYVQVGFWKIKKPKK